MTTNANAHATALRAVYLYTFDCFAVSPTEVADLPEVGNVRYARELLGLLVTANLVVESDVNGEEVVWQVSNPGTYDSATREQAEAVIDAFLSHEVEFVGPTPKPTSKRTGTASKRNPAALPLCLCGCGIPGKSDYRPGHDARHAGEVARAILALDPAKTGYSDQAHKMMAALSPALQIKAAAQVARGNAKVTAPKGKATPTQRRPRLVGRPVKVKVGRWVYDGEVSSVTVGSDGKENANSEVVALTYRNAKGNEFHAQVDSSAWKGAWSFAD